MLRIPPRPEPCPARSLEGSPPRQLLQMEMGPMPLWLFSEPILHSALHSASWLLTPGFISGFQQLEPLLGPGSLTSGFRRKFEPRTRPRSCSCVHGISTMSQPQMSTPSFQKLFQPHSSPYVHGPGPASAERGESYPGLGWLSASPRAHEPLSPASQAHLRSTISPGSFSCSVWIGLIY